MRSTRHPALPDARAPSETAYPEGACPHTTETIMKAAITRSGSIALLLSMAATAPAFAHHPMGGQTPQTFMNGLLSGLGHPIIGLDHLAAVVGVGILAGLAARGIVPVLAFSAAVIAGVVAHL
eukprot:Opistho-2@65834